MVRARWNGKVLAESDRTVVVEGNHYFPRSDVRMDLLSDNAMTTSCPWKGIASYYDVVVTARSIAARRGIIPIRNLPLRK